MDRHHEGHGYDLWMTPPEIFSQLDEMFPGWNFSHHLETPGIYGYFDPCPTEWDGKEDGLEIDWPMSVPVFVNPPYSQIKLWAAKCREQAERGCMVVLLIPSRTDTRYFHDHIYGSAALYFIKGRVKFIHPDDPEGKRKPAPFPSMLCAWGLK